ncbi:gamma-glutamyltransferase [Micromonospora sp. BRA006-A]|nr:gamma-glutamyltransferase [Micromonospora sp. BRA006-A]
MAFTTRPTLRGTFGMVSSTHWLASQSAMGVLERGGNAFDAAVAAGFVLHVVEPHLNGPAGEVPAILATAADPTPRVLCGQGPAPAAATVAHFRSLGLDLVPGAGPLAAVPGRRRRLAVAAARPRHPHARRGAGTGDRLRRRRPPAGRPGRADRRAGPVAVHRPLADLRTALAPRRPSARAGEMVTNPAYADTLRRLVDAGRAAGADREAQIEAARRAWREGFVAEAIDAFSRLPFRDSSGRAHAGLVTGDDLTRWSATWEEPVTLDWHGHTIAKTGFWGQGPVLLQTLAVLDALDDPRVYDPSSLEGIHAQAEALKLAFADREAWYGDTDVPGPALLSAEYARARAALVGDRADTTLRPGSPAGEPPRLPSHLRADVGRGAVPQDASTGEPTVRADGVTRGDTCHVDVVDRWGNIISATPSGGWLQSSPVIPGLGFPLGSRLQMSWLEEGLASTLRPGRRPRTTLSPTLVLRDGEPVMACGTPGGDQQDQWQLLFLLRHLAGGQELQEAIDAPTWHTTSFPASFYPREAEPGVLVLEDRIDGDVLAGLRARGHTVRLSDPWSLGRMCAVTRDPQRSFVRGSKPRGAQGYATGR